VKQSIVVMKFGGTSLRDAERVKNAAQRIVSSKSQGNRVVVVVSAPGDMTDELLKRAQSIAEDPDGRELDILLATGEQVSIALMCMAIKNFGVEAISLTGPQAGIQTDDVHTKARIRTVKPKKLLSELNKGRIVVVAGFQGLNTRDDIVTLGRGGSDLTAVALAAALKAEICEIYTDVAGVFTTDPRLESEAQKIDQISYDEMLELAGSGSQIMQARSIEVAKKFGVKIHVRSSMELMKKGTIIANAVKDLEAPVVTGVSYEKNEAKISISGVPDRPGVAAAIFGALAQDAINIDMIIQSAAENAENDISFTVARGDLKRALLSLESIRIKLGAKKIESEDRVAKISIVGVGMRGHSGVAAKMFTILARAGVNIEMISTSEIKISVVVEESDGLKTLRLLHKAFGLGKKR